MRIDCWSWWGSMFKAVPELSCAERDAAGELLNVGAGRAAASLSRMLGQEILLSVPSIELLPTAQLSERFGREWTGQVASVAQLFEGSFCGEALLLFPAENSKHLARLLTDEDVEFDEFTEMEQDVLTEVGNIVLNGCLSSLANMLNGAFATETPAFRFGSLDSVVGRSKGVQDGILLLAEVCFTVEESDLKGMLVMALPLVSLLDFQEAMAQLFED